MKTESKKSPARWSAEWMSAVVAKGNSMSARKMTSVDKRGGGLKTVMAEARKRKVHLLLFEDDRGSMQVVASTKRFQVIA